MKQIKFRKISPGLEKTSKNRGLSKKNNKRNIILGFMPYDPKDCECHTDVVMFSRKFGEMSDKHRENFIKNNRKLDCPRKNQKGMKKYKIYCNSCGELVGYIYSIDKKLTDWCDFHYVCSHDDESWYGCYTANIKDRKLILECACGESSRNTLESGGYFGDNKSKFNLILDKDK